MWQKEKGKYQTENQCEKERERKRIDWKESLREEVFEEIKKYTENNECG